MIELLVVIWVAGVVGMLFVGSFWFHTTRPEDFDSEPYNGYELAAKMAGRKMITHSLWWPLLVVMHFISIVRYTGEERVR